MFSDFRAFIDRYRNSGILPEFSDIAKNRCIAVCNQKGGCAKTTTAINLAGVLADSGYDVLIIDLDSQAHATLGLGADPGNLGKTIYDVLIYNENLESVVRSTGFKNLDIAPASSLLLGAQLELTNIFGRESVLRIALKKLKLTMEYDFIIFDCSPSLNLVTLNALTAAHALLIPIQTHYYSLEGMKELFNTIDIVRNRLNFNLEILGILPTLFDKRVKINQYVLSEIRKYFKNVVFKTVIHNNTKLCEAPIYKKPIHIYAKNSQGAKDYRALSKEVVVRLSQGKQRSIRQQLEKMNA